MSRNGAVYWPIKDSLEVFNAATRACRTPPRGARATVAGGGSGTVRLNQLVEGDHGKLGTVRQAQKAGVVMQA